MGTRTPYSPLNSVRDEVQLRTVSIPGDIIPRKWQHEMRCGSFSPTTTRQRNTSSPWTGTSPGPQLLSLKTTTSVSKTNYVVQVTPRCSPQHSFINEALINSFWPPTQPTAHTQIVPPCALCDLPGHATNKCPELPELWDWIHYLDSL